MRRMRVAPLFDWYVNGEVPIIEGGRFKVSPASTNYLKATGASIGAIVIACHLLALTDGREEQPPRATMCWWSPAGPCPEDGTSRRRTSSWAMWPRRSQRPRTRRGRVCFL